jgi:HK97 family phage prohead protease
MRPNHLSCNLIDLKLAPADSGEMTFEGYGAVFGNVDAYGDVIQKGAFTDYLKDVKSGVQQWPAMLSQHGGWGVGSTDYTPIGVWLALSEDDTGLKAAGTLADTDRGRENYALLKMQPRPAISGLSIGYYAKEFEYGGKSDNFERLIKKIDLVEISLVTFPANDQARINGVKSANDISERDIERALRELGISKKDAQIVISRGYKATRAKGDPSAELQQLKAAIDRNITLLSTN